MNIPMLNGKVQPPSCYFEDFLRGWNKSVKVLLKNKIEIINDIKRIDSSLRIIVHPTRLYRFMILKSLYPQEYLTDKINYDLLNFPYLINTIGYNICQREIESLNNLTIPTFYSRLQSNEVYDSGGIVVGKLNNSLLKIWLNFSTNIDSKFFELQLNILKRSIK
jgi:lantibiotic modifying enzyme